MTRPAVFCAAPAPRPSAQSIRLCRRLSVSTNGVRRCLACSSKAGLMRAVRSSGGSALGSSSQLRSAPSPATSSHRVAAQSRHDARDDCAVVVRIVDVHGAVGQGNPVAVEGRLAQRDELALRRAALSLGIDPIGCDGALGPDDHDCTGTIDLSGDLAVKDVTAQQAGIPPDGQALAASARRDHLLTLQQGRNALRGRAMLLGVADEDMRHVRRHPAEGIGRLPGEVV